MSASWDSDLSSIIEKTNNNLKLLRKIGDKPQVRSPDVSVTAAGHPSARPRAFVGAQEDAGSTSSRGSARPRAFIRGDDDTSSMGSRGSARPKAYVRGDDDTGSMGSHTSARPKAFIRADDDSGSVSSRASARPKAFIRPDDDVGSASSRASARPKAFIRADDDSGSVSSRASARPKAFIRGDDDTGSMSSRSSARPKAFVRGDDDTGSMNSSQGIGRSRLDSGSSSGRPHVGIAGGGGLTAAMLQQHRATATGGTGLGMADLGAQRSRFDLDETRSMSGVSASRLRRPLGANGRVPHARGLGASMGPRIRVPDADIPSDAPNHMVDEIKKSLETHFASRNGAVDKKVADLRTDVAGLTTQTSSLSSQISELRDAVLVSANSSPSINAPSASDPKIFASVQANAAAIARLEEHSADLLGRKVSVDRELTELGSRVKALSSATMKIPTLEDNVEALVANRQKQEQGLFKLADRVQLMHRQMGSLVDMKAVENLLSIRLTREFREMEDRLAQNVVRMAEKMELKVQSMEKQSFSQRQESLAALKSDLTDDIQRLQSSALRKSDLLPLQNAQTQSKEDVAQLSSALDRQEKKLQDAKLANAALRDELADARTELNKALQSQQRSTSALMEEKLEQITTKSKEKSSKVDDQLSELAKKQKKLEEATKTLQETMTQVKAEAGQRWSRSSADREEENDKLRQRLARSVAELEALATTKAEVERRFTSEEQNFQSRLKELRVTLTETEKQKESQRLELMQKLQEESKLMGVAQGKNSLLETLLAREKAENEEKNELVRKSKKEVTEVREQIRNLESEKEKKVRQLTSELQAKQTQVGLLTKTLKRIETASAKMLDLSKREAKTVRRVKATKEHELFIAQLKLKEMERVAQALQNGDEMKKQAALTAASTEERKELEKLLLESQLEKDELKQELEEMTEELNAAKESQKVIMEDTITKLSSDYDDKISELKQQIADKEHAMRQLRDTLVEKSNLDALEDELAALRDEKNDLLEQIQRAQIEHERVTLKTETNLRLEHATEFAAMKAKFEERISELEGAKSELEKTKTTVAELEKELKEQEALHQREVATRTDEIKEARSKIDECTAQILDLEETKARLEGDVSQMEANIGGASAEQEEELEAIKSQMQTEVEKLRAELALVSSTLEEKQTQLREAKLSDESNRQRLVEMAMAQEEMQSRYVSQIDSLTLKLNQERENSRAREQDLEDTIDKLNADVKTLKTESSKELEAARSELTDQMTELTATLKASQHREQQLQSRLKRILEELVQAANASGESEVAQDAEMSDDEAITHHLDALYATHRRTAHELDRLQAEYELTVKQAAADSATAQELDNQVKEHETQINELESVVEQLREELKEQYHKSAVIAKGSDEFSDEMATLREEKRQLERQLQEEERDREIREVSYQRRTEMKEREVEELRNENKTLTAAVAAVREKIRAVENVKFNDLGSLQNKLKDLEERTAALQLDEKSVANLEQDFTATRHEIVTLTAEVQSLYQKLTACCGIVEWSELRASVFDEEEKLTRVRSENARELAKVESVEQEVLTNAEFLNALLVAHGSTGGDGDLLNDFRWMQKYASIAPEIVEKLRTVETRLRDAVLDDSTWPFQGASKVPEGAARPPKSQKSAVDGAAIALALEKAREDYFSETSDGADEELQHDVDQPDVEQEGLAAQEGEGASLAHVDVEDQGSIGALSHDDSGGTCAADDLVVAEHVVHDEQDRSREKHFDDEELSVTSEQDRIDEDGLESRVDRKTDETTNARIEAGFSGDGEDDDDMAEEVERRVLEHSSKQVNPRIDNECDDSDEFATTIVHVETEEQSAADAEEADELDPLEESSFDNAVIAALESREAYSTPDLISSRTNQRCEVEADSEAYVAQDAITESSFDESMLSDNDEANCDDVHQVGSYSALPSERVFQSNNSFLSMESGAEVVEGSSPNIGQLEQDNGVEASSASRNPAGQLAEELGELKESATSKELEKSAREHEEESAPDEARGDEDHVVTELSSTVRRTPLGDFDGKSWKNAETKPSHHVDNALDELSASGDRDVLVERSREGNELEQSVGHDHSEDMGQSTSSLRGITHRAEGASYLGDDTAVATCSLSVEDDASMESLDESEEHSTASDAIVAHEDGNVEAFSSSLASGLPENGSSTGRTLDIHPHGSKDDGIHTDRREAVVFRSDILESSFNPDVQSDFDDEASAELSTLPIKRQDEAEDEWSQEQLRVAEHSLDGALVPEDDEKAATGTLASDPAPPLTLSIEDDENSVEETMAAQSQPIASLNRFGMGSRRFNLEEDDEMDEIERLLLDQSATSLQKRQQRSGRSSTMDDEDEIGEPSLQYRGNESDEFGEESMRSKDDNEFEEDLSIDDSDSNTLADQHDEDSAAAELPTTGRRSELSESCDEANTKNMSASSFEGVETKRLHEEHAAISSEIGLDQLAASIASAESEESTPSAGNNTAAASSYAQYSEASLERASRHTYDDTLAFQSADDDTEPIALENSFDGGMQSDGASPMPRRLEDGDSSEEETMPVQTLPTFLASLSRFGTGSRRSNLEEDDEMDEIERLLLDQSASSMQKRQQQPGRSSTMDDDDEFGESSLQSRGEESDEFGEESMRSKDDNEFVDVLKRSGDDTVDVLSAHDKQLLPSSLTRRRLTEEYEGNEVSEELTSAMRRTPSEESAASLKNVEHEPSHEDNELEQSAASIASGDYAEELEESASSVQSTTQRYKGKNCNISVARADTEQLDASNSFDNDAATDDLYTYATDPLQGSALSVDNDGSDLEESSSSLASGSRGEDAPARATHDDASYTNRDAVVESRPDPLESSFDADVEPDGDDEARASFDTEIATQPTKHREEADDKWRDEQLRHEHPPSRFMAGEEESDVDDNEPARTPAMTLRTEEDKSSEEETRPLQTQPTFSASLTRLGMSSRRLNLEEDDEMDEIERSLLHQRASSRQERQQQPRPGARDDEGEFGESSVQSRDDEEDAIGGDSIRSHEDNNECGDVLTRPRGNEFDARSIQHDEETGRQQSNQVTGGTRHQVSDDDDEVGEDDALEASPARFDEGALAASFDEDTELELAAAGIPSSHQAEEITTFKESTSSMRSGDQHVTHGNALQNSVVMMDRIELAHGEATKPSLADSDFENDTGLHTDGVEHSTSSFDTTAVAFEEDEGNAPEASSSCLASEARDNYSRSSTGRTSDIQPHDSEDDGIHTDRGEAVVYRSDILESSFDPDVQSDFDDEASAELSTLPIKRQDEAEDEWSQEQLRVAEHSLDGALVPEDDEKAATGTLASDPAPPLTLSIEDDENSVEETMAAQSQPIASLNRFGMGSRRFNLEEDDEMDEIERLLLDQSATSLQKRQQRSGRSSTMDDEDEIGEPSLQYRGNESDEFGEESMRSKDDNEFEEDLSIDDSDSNTLADQHDEDSAAAELPTTGRRSELSESCDEANTKNMSASSFEGVETKRLHEEHATIRSEIELDQSAASIASAESEESTPSAGNNTAAASSYAQYSEASLERASRHTNDDTLAFQSADDDTEPNPLENSFDEGMQSDGASPIARRLEEGDSSEEETMAVQTQLTFSASLSRFGTGSRRSNLEEDDEMDEIERLLLDQSASSMQKRQQQPGRSSTMDDEDEIGESSLQSRGEESDEFGEESMRSKDDNEFVDVSKRSGDDTVDVLSAHDKQLLPSSLTRRRLTEEYEGNEVSEELTSAMRRTPSEESAASLKNVEHEPPHEDNELEQSAASIASGDYAEELEESASSVQSTTQRYKGKNCNISVARADTEQLDASNSFDNDAATDDLYTYATDPLQGSALSVDNDGSDLEESSSSLASGSRGEDAPARATLDDASYTNRDAVVESRPDPLESSFDADVEPDGDDEARASFDTEIATQPTKHREEADDKWRDEQLRHEHPPSRFMAGEEESDVDDNEPARTPAMTLRTEEDKSSEEETRPLQTQPTFSASLTRLGMSSRRLNLEEDDEMDEIERLLLHQRASSRQERQQQPRPGARDDEGEFGESSVQSRDDEEDAIGGDSIRSHEDNNECGDVLTRPRGNEFDARSIQHDEETGRQQSNQVTGGTRHQVSDDDDEVGEDDALEASPARFDEGALAASFDEDTELELAAAGIPSSHQAEEITTFKESTSSMRSGDQHVTHGNALQNSVVMMDRIELAHGEATKPSLADSDFENDTGLHTDGVEHSTSSFDTTAVAFEEDEGNAPEASSSCLASEARDNYSRSSTGRTSDIQPHDSEDDGIHTDRGEAVVYRSDILESSFDPDVQSDFDDEASAELSTLPIKRQDEAEDEWSQEQLRVAEHSLDGALVPEDDEKAATGTLASDPAPPLTLSIEDDENSVEETMAAQSQPIASLNRFGMGSRRFNLEEDDEMDEIERLLLDQSATSLQKRQQRSGRSSTMDDEDEIGEPSLQYRGNESDEFGEESMRSKDDNEFEEDLAIDESDSNTLADQHDEDSAAAELPTTGRRSELSESCDKANARNISASSFEGLETKRLHEEHATIRSEIELDQLAASIASAESEEPTPSAGNDAVAASRSQTQYSEAPLERASRHTYDDTLAFQSDDDDTEPNPLENSFDEGMQSDGASPIARRLEDGDSSEEETMPVQTQSTFSASLSRFGTGSRRSNLEEDDETDEIERLILDQSASSMQKRQQQPGRSSRPGTTDEDDEFGELSLPSRGDESDEFTDNSIRSREENELEGVSTRQWDNAFAVRSTRSNEARQQQGERFTRPNATDDEDELAELSRESHTDDIEFGKDSLRLRAHQDEKGETLIRSRSHEEDDFGEASIGSRDGEPVEVANTSRLHGEGGWNLRETNELSQALSSLRGEHELGRTPIHSYLQEENEHDESTLRSHRKETPAGLSDSREDYEFGEASMRSGSDEDDDDFGEMSIPLQEEEPAAPPAPSRLLNVRDVEYSTRPANFSGRDVVSYHEGLMHSPVKPSNNTTAAASHNDSASEVERDYMDDSFDLDESLEEQEDGDERDV
ncbi:hypothetical protein GN958_ATG12426 [Phytophthora infestans]|uniref:Uncharacterized protein n=1 Tax=Phytophthora infestans TaxID=4787 RepID=A0A8S9UHL3_PHYIN|nr:hypothetical protein GN958_ATG12426 [Phytophthora infestans]